MLFLRVSVFITANMRKTHKKERHFCSIHSDYFLDKKKVIHTLIMPQTQQLRQLDMNVRLWNYCDTNVPNFHVFSLKRFVFNSMWICIVF